MMSGTMDAPRRKAPALALAGAALLAVLAAPAPADRPLSERVVIRRDTFGVPHVLA
jgi:acyl-homoserine lactone acylase PvdQ